MKPTLICKLVKAGQKAKAMVKYVASKSIGLSADLGFGVMRLRESMLSWATESLRAHRDSCRRASEVRHVIFSAQKGMARRAAVALLHGVFADWRKTYAPGRPWVAALQIHNGIYHLHVAVSNVDSAGRPIKFLPHQVVAMADMQFTELAASAKGEGKKGLSTYTKARKKLAVEDLAALLAAPGGGIEKAVWERLKKKGLVSEFRERQDGSLISFSYEGRRIRFATLEAFVGRIPTTETGSDTGATVAEKPAEPLPGSRAAKLAAAGFSNKDLDTLQNNLRSAKATPQKRTKRIDKAKHK